MQITEKKESFSLAVTFMLVSAVGLSVAGLLAKIGGSRFSLPSMIFWRFFAAFLLFLFLFWVAGKFKEGMDFSHAKLNFFRAFLTLGAQYSFFYYIQQSTLLNALVLLNTGPIFIPLIAKGFLGHKVGKSSWIGIGVSFIGMLCVLQPGAGIFSFLSLIGLLSGLCQGGSQVLFGIGAKGEKPEFNLLFLFFFCMVISLIPYLFFDISWNDVLIPETMRWKIFFILALGVASIFNQVFRALAYLHGNPTRLAVFLYAGVLFGGVFDWAIFNDVPNELSMIGAILVILGGVLKIYLRGKTLGRTS